MNRMYQLGQVGPKNNGNKNKKSSLRKGEMNNQPWKLVGAKGRSDWWLVRDCTASGGTLSRGRSYGGEATESEDGGGALF